ncbi:carbohydrate ABC transporter permease [Conexibacter sp. CPCC 206217]|uniref:carbohydrate ABC transporter permease n=1 Tax=Conexibacter sp. CPCC 206217 TaxID=3064574 RepID=UPI002719703E|nr:sugar ABC transporter permease [Conexibacter sp. CPCC 206217]MDO8211049.1 sugar ABC transporter permease [Conexibacter sp. CPCC 206217]
MTRRVHPVFRALALPGVFALVAFTLVPVVAGGLYAFTDWGGLGDANWIGLDNFRQIFEDPLTRGALWHTLVFGGALVVLTNAAGLALALGLNRTLKSRNLLRAVFFLPVILSPLAVSYVWKYILDPSGPVNSLFAEVGLESWQHAWLGDPEWALIAVLVVLVWQQSGLAMVIYLAGLQSIPDDLVEASAVDGASSWLRLRRITLPLLRPAFIIASTLTLIFGLRVFDQILGLTGGGPVGATETLATQVWKQSFADGRFGYGAALSIVLTLIIGTLALLQLVALRRQERDA